MQTDLLTTEQSELGVEEKESVLPVAVLCPALVTTNLRAFNISKSVPIFSIIHRYKYCLSCYSGTLLLHTHGCGLLRLVCSSCSLSLLNSGSPLPAGVFLLCIKYKSAFDELKLRDAEREVGREKGSRSGIIDVSQLEEAVT